MRLSTGRILADQECKECQEAVARDLRLSAHAMRKGGQYASHITEQDMDEFLAKELAYADEVASGLHNRNFTIWQRVDYMMTGECIAFLPN